MPRLLHMADVHLGARHDDLGPAAATQRGRQFDAFQRAIDLALTEQVDLVLICGDLFDSNSQPRRSVERAAAELSRLVARGIPATVIPGTHDCYDQGSIYRVFDLAALAGSEPGSGLVTVLTDSRGRVDYPDLRLTVHAPVYPTKRAPESPLAAIRASVEAARSTADGARRWQVGMVHGSIAVPGRFDQDDVAFTEQEIAESGLDYLALGHWHSYRDGRAGRTTWAYAGAPEVVAVDQDGAGQVLLVELEERDGQRRVTIQRKPVGRSRFARLEIDAATVTSQADVERRIREMASPDLVLNVRLVGVRADTLDVNVEELERAAQDDFLRLRVRDASVAAMPEGVMAPADTILGAMMRDFRARIEDHEVHGEDERAAELREALRIGVLLLDDPQRVTLA